MGWSKYYFDFIITKASEKVYTNYFVPSKTHTKPLFIEMKILPINQVYLYSIIMFMFKLDSGQLPEVFNKLFIKNLNIHQYETRQSTLLHVQKARITLYQKSLKYTGVSAWNFVKNKLNVNCSFYLFKQNLKSFLLADTWLNF